MFLDDTRTISFHEFPWEIEGWEEDYHSKILLYYLSKNNDKKDYRPDENLKEGYIIEAKIQSIATSKIKYITKSYFDKIYGELQNINFETLAKNHYTGCDGWQLEIEMGLNGSCFNGYTRKLSLWSPSEHDAKPELLKLLRILNNIKKKIEFDQWYKYNRDELKKYREIIGDCSRIFRYRYESNHWNDRDYENW